MRFLRTMLVGCATVLTLAQPLSAQGGSERQGTWFGFGLGTGWTHVTCELCDADRQRALSGNVKFGFTLSPSVLLGAEVNGWFQSEENIDELLGSFSGVVYWYPLSRGHLQLKGGLAVLKYRISDEDNLITTTAFGPELGAAYEIRITRQVSLDPYLHAIITPSTAELRSEGTRVIGGVGLSLLQLSLALTWH